MDEMADVEARLAAAHEAVRQRDSLQRRLAIAAEQLDRAERELAAATQQAQLESTDVRKLETFSGKRVWAVLKGSRSTDLEREQAEADAAQGKVAEARVRRDMLARERESLEHQLGGLRDADTELAAATDAKEALLLRSDSPEATRLVAIAEERGRLEAEQRELQEALEAGEVADARLRDLWGELSSASGWSTYDTFLGGGMFSTAIKHDHMDRAAALSRHADEALAVLGRELQDTGAAHIGQSVAMSEGTRFLDMWFDNIFTDLTVANQINDALNRTQRVAHQVGEAVQRCRQRLAEVTSKVNDLMSERRSLLT